MEEANITPDATKPSQPDSPAPESESSYPILQDRDPVSSASRAFLEHLVQKEVDDIIRTGDMREFLEDEQELAPVPIRINEDSSKTLRWLSSLLEAIHGSSETPTFPLANVPSIPIEEKKIELLEYEVTDFDQPVTYDNVSMLSKLISVRVRFRLNWSNEERTDSFIIKVPPEGLAERELADMARTDRHEIFCYSRIFPFMMEWSLLQNIEVVFAVPKCYYARINRKFDSRTIPNVLENIPEAESILVFEDLRPHGFGKRHFVEGLSVEEVKASICEIAKIHAISYSVQQRNKAHMTHIFGPLHKPLEIALMYDVLLEDAYPILRKFLSTCKGQVKELVGRIRILADRTRGLLTSMLEPSPSPFPTCLVHMDLWCDNILFRRRNSWENLPSMWINPVTEEEEESDSNSSLSSVSNGIEGALGRQPSVLRPIKKTERPIQDSPLECRILDWQMVTYGRPTHDLALLLVVSLPADIRRKYTNYFLKYYYQVFKNTAGIFGSEIFFDIAWLQKEYQRSKLLAAMLVIASSELAFSESSLQRRLVEVLLELASERQI